MASPSVVVLGALDTKGAEFDLVRSLIESRGIDTIVVDVGVMGRPMFTADVEREEVARAGGRELADLATGDHKDEAMQTMAAGAAAVAMRLHEEGRLDGIIGMGGTGGTSVATTAMRALPVGVPKLMVSTVGGGDVSAYAGTKDITFMPSVVDVSGINRLSRTIYANAAGAIAGMVLSGDTEVPTEDKPLVAASMFGNTTQCVDRARAHLEDSGYEVLVFHATGTGGRTMDQLVADGFITAVLDLTTTELADEVCGGVFNAGPDRGLAAARAGIPIVLAPGCVDMANFGGPDTVPERYRDRNLYEWNPNVTLLRTDASENARIGSMLAEIANSATGPVVMLLPLKGVSMLDSPGNDFWDPEADEACFDAIRTKVGPGVRVEDVDANINDPDFADRAASLLLEMVDARPPVR